MLNVHLEDILLQRMGVDAIQIDLEEETQRGGPYFLPMSKEHMNTFQNRPETCITYENDEYRSVWNFNDGNTIILAFQNELDVCTDKDAWEGWRGSHWRLRTYSYYAHLRNGYPFLD